MATVCLMLLLPDELLTKIIIHSIKDVAVFHFLNLRNKICDTFRRICNSDEVLLHVSLQDLREACKNRYVRSCFEYRCNPADPEAMALLQEISGGLSPPDGQWKNHNLRRLRYLIKQDLDNITWWYWLDNGDDDDDILLLPIQNPHICIWEAGCRRYGPHTKEIIH
jgi:hypothetical protein